MAEKRRVRARREMNPELKRTQRVPFTANDPEWDLITEAARTKGLPTAAWVRQEAMRSALRVVRAKETVVLSEDPEPWCVGR